MPSGPLEILHGGARYALVPLRDVHVDLDEAAARRLVNQGLREHGQRFARQLEELAQQLGGWMARDPVSTVIDALVSGRLVAVHWDAPVRLMSEPEPIELRDIGGGEVIGRRIGGDTPEPPAALRTTWLSFDVVDDRGEPFTSGRYDAAMDGRAQGGPLDAEVHRYDGLREGADAALHLEGIVWAFEPAAIEEPTAPSASHDPALPNDPTEPVEPDPIHPPPIPPSTDGPATHRTHFVSLEVVDQEGTALLGRYTLTDSADETHGDLGATLRLEVTGDAPTLRLHDIVLPSASAPTPPVA